MQTDHYRNVMESDTAVKTAVDLNLNKAELEKM
jgi:hypothetical protein